LKCCLNIDKTLIPKPVLKPIILAFKKPKPFERRGLDEKVVSFIYFSFADVGIVFLFAGTKIRW
jgi:hypothetical protein